MTFSSVLGLAKYGEGYYNFVTGLKLRLMTYC